MSENGQEKRETLADIVAEMRTRSREVKEAFGGRPDGVENMLDIWADRIEAIDSADAWRSLYTPGNAAAIYAALVKIHDLTNALDEKCGVDPVEIRDIARTALSAPARNCDVMSRSICTKHFSTIYEGNRDGLCDVQTEREKNIHLYYIEFNKWLFAPAAERKGECK